jgi:hypothetical protein
MASQVVYQHRSSELLQTACRPAATSFADLIGRSARQCQSLNDELNPGKNTLRHGTVRQVFLSSQHLTQ